MVRWYSLFILAACLIGLNGCLQESPLFELLETDRTNVLFSNTITDNDSLINALSFDNVYNGGGVAIGDFNRDGLDDVFFTGNMVSNRLYLNRGDFRFEDVTEAGGLKSTYWSTGVALVDINQDGWLDIYVCVAGTSASSGMANRLYVNQGLDSRGIPVFQENAAAYGIADDGFSVQAAFFDYDQDGDLDLFVLTNALDNEDKNLIRPRIADGSAPSTDRLYRNNGDLTFTNVSREAGILIEGYGLGVAVQDFNQDGWPDVFVSNDFLTNDLLYINNRNGTFTNKAPELLRYQAHSAMGNDAADINNDGLVDIFELDMLPRDRRREKLMLPPISDEMVHRIADQGHEPQYMRNMLHVNNGRMPDGSWSFSEVGRFAGISATDWSWAPLLADFDLDGYRDLFVTTGHRKDLVNLDFIVYGQRSLIMGTSESIRRRLLEAVRKLEPIRLPNVIYKNQGNLTFSDKTNSWGLDHPNVSQGCAYGDLDNDGDLDLVVNNMDGPASIYRNRAVEKRKGHFLKIRFDGPAQNRDGLGAKVRFQLDGQIHFGEVSPYRGFQSTVQAGLHFGLGKFDRVPAIEVEWPDGRRQRLNDIRSDTSIRFDYRQAGLLEETVEQVIPPLFVAVDSSRLQAGHKEWYVNDFRTNPLWPHKFSQEGPGLAIGDVDGNGLEDLYIGADRGTVRRLHLQTGPGRFRTVDMAVDTMYEDRGALFFDADGDRDLDLYVVSGGYFPPEESLADEGDPDFGLFPVRNRKPPLEDTTRYQDRLYVNDGQGRFQRALQALPPIYASGSCVMAGDFDADGDPDLFVGGRFLPGRFPFPPRSYILRNDSRKETPRFTDVTAVVAPDLLRPGLITSALWADIDADKRLDLLVAGEWMPIRVFRNTGGHLVDITGEAGLAKTNGWWHSLAPGDFDADGDLDFLAGNHGLNSKYRASNALPVRLYAGDFDRNGTLDPVLTRYVDGKEYVDTPRDILIRQIPGMKLRFKSYNDYASADLEHTFTSPELKSAQVYSAFLFESVYLENMGRGRFRITPLPPEAQRSPVHSVLVGDYDGDRKLDVILAGNDYRAEPMTGRYDALNGLVLLGTGTGRFEPMNAARSGIYIPGETRSAGEIRVDRWQSLLVFARNNDRTKTFVFRKNTGVQRGTPTIGKAGMFGTQRMEKTRK